jgi:hypothetical protein
MTNAWTTTRSDWLKMKKEWNLKIEDAGEKHNIPNPKFASRDGILCKVQTVIQMWFFLQT